MAFKSAKRHGWLVGALADKGYSQSELAKAWGCDDAVVSRFINSGKPDLTPQRQMQLSQILNLTNDQLLNRLYGDVPLPRVIQQQQHHQEPRYHGSNGNHDRPDVAEQIQKCVQSLQELLPGAIITVNISYKDKE